MGCQRIVGELKGLGLHASATTCGRGCARLALNGTRRGMTWREFSSRGKPRSTDCSQGSLSVATFVVRPEGLDPPAYRFEACRSIQLSYGRI